MDLNVIGSSLRYCSLDISCELAPVERAMKREATWWFVQSPTAQDVDVVIKNSKCVKFCGLKIEYSPFRTRCASEV